MVENDDAIVVEGTTDSTTASAAISSDSEFVFIDKGSWAGFYRNTKIGGIFSQGEMEAYNKGGIKEFAEYVTQAIKEYVNYITLLQADAILNENPKAVKSIIDEFHRSGVFKGYTQEEMLNRLKCEVMFHWLRQKFDNKTILLLAGRTAIYGSNDDVVLRYYGH